MPIYNMTICCPHEKCTFVSRVKYEVRNHEQVCVHRNDISGEEDEKNNSITNKNNSITNNYTWHETKKRRGKVRDSTGICDEEEETVLGMLA